MAPSARSVSLHVEAPTKRTTLNRGAWVTFNKLGAGGKLLGVVIFKCLAYEIASIIAKEDL